MKKVSVSRNGKGQFSLIEGESFELFLSRVSNKLDDQEVTNLQNSTKEILNNCVEPSFNTTSLKYNTGLVIGYVQSGKTMSFTSLIALARDNDYRIVIVISGRTNLLLKQTSDRLNEDLVIPDDNILIERNADFSIKGDVVRVLRNPNVSKTIIIPVLKHQLRLGNLAKLFLESDIRNYLKTRTVLIVDDESDQASLNTEARNNKKLGLSESSAIYASIKRLRASIPNHSYIQYTATPQANLLIDYFSLLSPDWNVMLTPGMAYTGGKTFFNHESNNVDFIPIKGNYPPDFKTLSFPPDSLADAIVEFFILSAMVSYKLSKDDKVFNKKTSMMIHPTWQVKGQGIDLWYSWTTNIIEDFEKDLEINDFSHLRKIYRKIEQRLKNKYVDFPEFDLVVDCVKNNVFYSHKVHKVVGGSIPEDGFPWQNAKHHILVGGQLLDRGFTVEDLILTYMPRDTKGKNQADTIEQRCRFFGYKKKYLDFCRVYLPQALIGDYIDYVEHEETLHNFLRNHSLDVFKKHGSPMLLNSNLIPTNQARISDSIVNTYLKGFQYFEPSYPLNVANDILSREFLKSIQKDFVKVIKPKQGATDYTEHRLFKVDIESVSKYIEKFELNNAFEQMKKVNFLRYMDFLSELKGHNHIWFLEMSYKLQKGKERTVHLKEAEEKDIKYYDSLSRSEKKVSISKARKLPVSDERKLACLEELEKDGKNIYKISQLPAGYPREFGDTKLIKGTPGIVDYKDELIVQLHKVYAKEKTDKAEVAFYDESFYTLAFSFSDNMANRYIKKKDHGI